MSDLIVLIGPENGRQFNSLSKAIRGVGVGDIHQADGADEALRWLGLYHCDVCVISNELPGKRDGLDALLDIRSHRQGRSIIMISRSKSEKIAVGAFHAGVVDCVPIYRSYENAVASLISQIKISHAGGQIVPPEVEDRLFQPTYQNKLRVIGRHLDVYGFRRVNILEVDGGIIVRATPSGDCSVETLEFVDRRFVQLIATAASNRGEGEAGPETPRTLLPTGYEDFLGAVGHLLDQHAAGIMQPPARASCAA